MSSAPGIQQSAGKLTSGAELLSKRQSSSQSRDNSGPGVQEPVSKKVHKEERSHDNHAPRQSKSKNHRKQEDQPIKEEILTINDTQNQHQNHFNISVANTSFKNGTVIPTSKIKLKEEPTRGVSLPPLNSRSSLFTIKHIDYDDMSPKKSFPQPPIKTAHVNSEKSNEQQSDYYKMAQHLMKPNNNIYPNLDENYMYK